MDKWIAVIRREYVEQVRTKSFIIGTALVPLLMGGMMFLPTIFARQSTDRKVTLAVVDRTGIMAAALDRELASDPNRDFFKEPGRRRYEVKVVPEEAAAGLAYEEFKEDDGRTARRPVDPTVPGRILRETQTDALVDLGPETIAGAWDPFYFAYNVGDFQPIRRVEVALNTVTMAERLRRAGAELPPEEAKKLTHPLDLLTRKVGKDGSLSERDFGEEYFTAIIFALSFYMTTIISGTALSRGLLEEKSNRVIEVLISSITPSQLMTGKIAGHALVMLTQFGIWVVMIAAFVSRGSGGGMLGQALASFSLLHVGLFVMVFLLGYVFYATLFSAVGAVCTTEMEAQQTQMPLVLMQAIPFVSAIAVVRQPDGSLSTWLSMIPFFAPNMMMMRMVLQMPPLWQFAASLGILAVSVAAAFWVVQKIFRIGILMTGKKPTIPEIARWLRAT